MSTSSSPQRPTMPPKPEVLIADASRNGDGRSDPRPEFVRERPREPHEKYDLGRSHPERGMTYQWASVKIPYSSIPNPRLAAFRGAGWQFARAEDFPEHSGYRSDREANKRLIELGIDVEVRADDPVIKDNLVLMVRPKHLSKEAENEQKDLATRQISEHLRRQREMSEKAIGSGRTTMRQHFGPGDEAPSDHEVEV